MRRVLFLFFLLCCACVPAAAHASYRDLIRECVQDGAIKDPGKYSQGEYKKALRDLPTDVDEYTDCRDVISRAQGRAARKSGGGGPGGGSGSGSGGSGAGGSGSGGSGASGSGAGLGSGADANPANPGESGALNSARGHGDKAVPLGPDGQPLTPGGTGAQASRGSLPGPVIALLILLGLGALLAAFVFYGDRVPFLREPAQAVRSRVLRRRQV